jgi:2-polyprenyl-3-methyl-5-hydroxy-6-metoxy-1,4-benzoquinol methylase
MKASDIPSISGPFNLHRSTSDEAKVLSRTINPWIAGTDVLVDIGAGDGSLTRALCIGRKIIAVEPYYQNTKQLMKLLSESHYQVILDTVDNVQIVPRSVDVILFCHVLYYMRDICDVISKALDWLKPTGMLIFVLLARGGDQSTIIKKYWRQYHTAEQELHPNSTELRKILGKFCVVTQTKEVTSYRRIKTKLEQIQFLSFSLDVSPLKLHSVTKNEFRRLLMRRRPFYRAGHASTRHELMFCRVMGSFLLTSGP